MRPVLPFTDLLRQSLLNAFSWTWHATISSCMIHLFFSIYRVTVIEDTVEIRVMSTVFFAVCTYGYNKHTLFHRIWNRNILTVFSIIDQLFHCFENDCILWDRVPDELKCTKCEHCKHALKKERILFVFNQNRYEKFHFCSFLPHPRPNNNRNEIPVETSVLLFF